MKSEIDIKDITNRITLYIKIKRIDQWRTRFVIARLLLRAAAKIAWINLEIQYEELEADEKNPDKN